MGAENLYIIGNGFDLAHGLPTKYANFREYLIKKETENELKATIELLVGIIDKHDSEKKSEKDWSQLEEYCGEIQLKDANIDLSDRYYYDKNGDEQQIPYTREEKGREVDTFEENINYLNILFAEWVNTINVRKLVELGGNRKIDYFTRAMCKQNYVILNFNYTDTLEELYGVDENNICHIHGKIGEQKNYYFGHGKEVRDFRKICSLSQAEPYYDYLSDETGISFPNVNIRKKLFKDTQNAYECNKAFFGKMSDLTDIYVYGFSFGDVDLFYLNKINEKAPKARWHIYQYGRQNVDAQVKKKLLNINKDMEINFWNMNEGSQI